MPLSKAAVGLALVAVGTAACLGSSLAQRGLLKPTWAAPAAGEAWALARYEGWLSVLFAQCAAWLAVPGAPRPSAPCGAPSAFALRVTSPIANLVARKAA